MNKNTRNIIIAVVLSLFVGGAGGFILGIGVSTVGKEFMEGLADSETMAGDERKAEIANPKKLEREAFELRYPSNWEIDTADEDYDPDAMFSIDSPGNAFVMFIIGAGETEPGDNLEMQLEEFKKLMNKPSIQRFEKYGRFTGKGAILKGRVMGSRTTVKLFSFYHNDMTVMISQQYPDEDLKHVQEGFDLIEQSFTFK